MRAIVKEVTPIKSIIEVETNSGLKTLEINETLYGHSYDDFAQWDITDAQFERLEELVDSIIKQMEGDDDLEVIYE